MISPEEGYMKKAIFLIMMLSFSGGAFCGPFGACGQTVFKYVHGMADGSAYQSTTEYFVSDSSSSGYSHLDPYSKWEVESASDGKPVMISYAEGKDCVVLHFDGSGNVVMTGTWKGEDVAEHGRFSPSVTLENMTVVRSLDFESGEKVEFDLLQVSEFPGLTPYEMYFQVVGRETVSVPAGTFDCRKVLFSLVGFRGMFYKAYYYVTDDDRRYVVKMENMPRGGHTELVAVGNPSEND